MTKVVGFLIGLELSKEYDAEELHLALVNALDTLDCENLGIDMIDTEALGEITSLDSVGMLIDESDNTNQ
jgi:hypothetical protein